MNRIWCLSASLLLVFACAAQAETITLATYNVQLFNDHFLAHHLTGRGLPETMPLELRRNPQVKMLIDDEREQNDKENYFVSTVILDPKFSPDVICFEECCDQVDLEYFNHRWLHDAYATVMVFPTNSTRHQSVAMMLKAGFTLEEKKDQYYKEKDPVPNARGDKLFARGPSFCKIKTPGGYEFWMGVTHQKSKRVDPPLNEDGTEQKITKEQREPLEVEAAKWRLREATRTHAIMKELSAAGPADVVLVGDMNDEYGADEIETKAGGDGVGSIVGPAEDNFYLATMPLVEAKEFSFGGYWNERFRTLIDHVVVTPSVKPKIQSVQVFKEGLAAAASDHYPVMVKLNP